MMTTSPLLVHIIVLNYCSLSDTLACVDAARKINYPHFRLLIVDNNSPDGSGKELEKLIPSREFIQTGRNLGYAGGNNQAIRHALRDGADFVLIVNPDVRLPPDCLETYIEVMSRNPSIGGLNSVQLQGNGVDIDSGFRIGVLRQAGFDMERFDPATLPDMFDTPILYGAALMLSVRALRKVGGFDPLFFAYYEEIDLCRRLRLHGFNLVVTARSPVLHMRTQYAMPLSRRVRFLRLKGYYLSRLKSRDRPMRKSFLAILREIYAALRGRASNIYPYDSYPYDARIVLQSFAWLVCLLPVIWWHKKMEVRDGPRYL